MRKIVSVLLVAVFALFLGGCSGGLDGMTSLDTTNDDYKFDGIQQQLTVINQAITGNEDVIKGIQDNVAAIQAEIAADETADHAELEALRLALQTEIDVLKDETAGLRTDLTTLQGTVGGIQDNVTILQGQVDALRTKVCGLSKKICILFSKLNALCARLDRLAAAVATFGITAPQGDLGTGFYLDVTTGFVYQWIEGGWTKIGALLVGVPADVDPLKAPMFVVDAKNGNNVKVSWTKVEGANGYVVYAMTYCNGVINTAAVAKTQALFVDLGTSVGPIALSSEHGPPPPFPADSSGVVYVVVAVPDFQNPSLNQGLSSYAVGPLTGDFRGL